HVVLAVARFALARQQANRNHAEALVAAGAARGVAVHPVLTINHAAGVTPCVEDRARLHDLSVIGVDPHGLLSDRVVAECLLFGSGRPLLIAPAVHTGELDSQRIVVAWDNSRTAARALGDALALLPGVAEVVLLSIGEEKTIHSSLSDDETIEALTRRGLKVLIERRGLGARTIGRALQDTARELGAGVLVMGGFGHSRLRDFVLGGATKSVLADPQLPLFLSH
ncbi:MAG TPA: universal stress protein, partial [Novosphingobium sp.]|nr:universal stress protein [Novosphingobium sp.]